MSRLLLAIAFLIPLQVSAKWEPPANPDPDAIRNEARADAQAGRFDQALAKQLWFYRHALDYDASLYGVRLSIALKDWYDLGKVYPPAMAELRKARDVAEQQVMKGQGDVRLAFHDMSSINEVLGDEKKTADTFVLLDKRAPETAKKVYDLAQRALVKAKQFALCGKYVQPEEAYAHMVKLRGLDLKLAEQQKSLSQKRYYRDFAESNFLERAGTLVALLALNDEKQEAGTIAERARSESKSPERDSVIDAALKGTIPKREFDR